MKKKFSLLNIFLCFLTIASCETNDPEGEVTIPYTITSYFLGNEKDKVTNSKGGIVMMGGNRENDEAMKWFLDRANGVLSADGKIIYTAENLKVGLFKS